MGLHSKMSIIECKINYQATTAKLINYFGSA